MTARHSIRPGRSACLPAALAILLAWPAHAASSGPTITVMQHPEVAEASRFQTIAVAPVAGPHGELVVRGLETLLLNARVQDRPVFRAVMRGTAKADGILSAEVLGAAVRDERYSKTESVCDRYRELPKDASIFRQLFGKECVSQRNVDKPCTRRRAEFSLSVRLTDAANARTVYSEIVDRTAQEEACQGDAQGIADGNALLSQTVAAAMQRVKEAITPTMVELPLVVMPPDSAIASDGDRARFEGAIRFARERRLDRACETFRELADAYRGGSVALNYNLGFCDEADGNIWGADENYRRADRLTNEPDKTLAAALSRTQTAIKRLDAQGKARPDLVAAAGSALAVKPTAQPQLAVAVSAAAPIPPELLIEDKRTALVIGNSKYPTMPLANPANDAADIADRLRKLKFDVVYAENAKLRDMDRAFDEFVRRLKPGGVALVFYAGHGVQVAGENWLVPVDATLQNEREVPRQAFALNQVMERLDVAKPAVNIVILDACRNDPFTRSWKRAAGGGGLATVQAPSGTLVAYSTAPGKTAEDGDGRNSPYTKALLKSLAQPNLKLEDVFKHAGRGVMQATENRQVPWNNSSVTGDFYFSASQVAAAAPQAVPAAPAKAPPVATRTTAPPVEMTAPQAPVQAAAAPVPPKEKGPKEACADRPNFISRQLCESRKCAEPQFANDPYCDTYNRKPEPAF